MIIERVAGAIACVCFVAYFVDRLGLAALPGIPSDYSTLGMLALWTMFIAQRMRGRGEMGGVIG